MRRPFTAIASLALSLAFTLPAIAQQVTPNKAAAAAAPSTPKAGAGEKVCRHKFPDGTPKAWVCKAAEPCCAWDEIKYVKCGSTVFKCL
jgi:hypothetical protein